MTNSSLRRVTTLLPCLLLACAHELDSYPEQLQSDDASVLDDSAAGTHTGGAAALMSQAGGPATEGSAGKPNVVLPSSGGASSGAGGAEALGAGRPGTEQGGTGGARGGAAGATTTETGAATGGAGGGGGTSTAGAAAAGADNGGAGSDGGSCADAPKWSAKKYDAGDRVQSGGSLYECKPFPYVGWCGLDAYEPGKGQAWADAWTLVGGC